MPWFSAMKSGSVVKVFPVRRETVSPPAKGAWFLASCGVAAARNIQRSAAAWYAGASGEPARTNAAEARPKEVQAFSSIWVSRYTPFCGGMAANRFA
jgi:hypothetical protein